MRRLKVAENRKLNQVILFPDEIHATAVEHRDIIVGNLAVMG